MDAQQLRTRLRDSLAVRPRVSRAAAVAARAVGRADAAAVLRQLSTDLVTVAPPATATGGRTVRVRLPGRAGRDQVATALRDGGWDGFEPPMPTVFAACAAAFTGVVYDVGANTGFYSVIAAAVNKENTVVAFEPFPPVRATLYSTLRLNRCASRVRVEPYAVSAKSGEDVLYIPVQDHGLVETSASLNSSFKETFGEALPVRITTIDDWARDHHLGRTTVMKIDVESLEAQVLRGAVGILKTHRPVVFYEMLPSGDARAIERLRREVRYVDIRLHTDTYEVGRAVGFDPDGWNHVLVPQEKLATVVALAQQCGLTKQDSIQPSPDASALPT